MSLNLGSTSIGSLYLGSTKIGEAYLGNVKVYSASSADPYNPLGLPAYTMRVKFADGVTPSFSKGTGIQVTSSPNVWDVTYNNTNWDGLLANQSNLIEVLGANSTGVTSMQTVFRFCSALTNIAIFDTSAVTNISQICQFCNALTTVPTFDTSNVWGMYASFASCPLLENVPLLNTNKVTNMNQTFSACYAVQSGALALYQQASTQAAPPSGHTNTFQDCGRDTVAGAAELAQIPASWGGTGS